jgi:heme exporter protein D
VRRPAAGRFGTVGRMGRDAVFVWIMLGLSVVVLVLIALYVDSLRRRPP